jgi:putative chitinase
MFPGRLRKGHEATVETGLPVLLSAMQAAEINTPRRIAAFLTTLVSESWLEYDVHQLNDARPYAGRGYIQLTGMSNYSDAGKYLGVDLVTTPSLAQDLRYSARIATWYWTVARHCNQLADDLKMGKINAAIGYPLVTYADGTTNDQARCNAFSTALAYLTGSIPSGIDCTR